MKKCKIKSIFHPENEEREFIVDCERAYQYLKDFNYEFKHKYENTYYYHKSEKVNGNLVTFADVEVTILKQGSKVVK